MRWLLRQCCFRKCYQLVVRARYRFGVSNKAPENHQKELNDAKQYLMLMLVRGSDTPPHHIIRFRARPNRLGTANADSCTH